MRERAERKREAGVEASLTLSPRPSVRSPDRPAVRLSLRLVICSSCRRPNYHSAQHDIAAGPASFLAEGPLVYGDELVSSSSLIIVNSISISGGVCAIVNGEAAPQSLLSALNDHHVHSERSWRQPQLSLALSRRDSFSSAIISSCSQPMASSLHG